MNYILKLNDKVYYQGPDKLGSIQKFGIITAILFDYKLCGPVELLEGNASDESSYKVIMFEIWMDGIKIR